MSRVRTPIFLGLSTALACAIPLYGQYPGRIASAQPPGTTHLRATAVLEFTGDLKDMGPNRLVPIAVWDGTRYQPGALYLAQPAPLAVLGGTQYQLETDGRSQGFFNVKDAENLAGGWIGVGKYQPPPAPKPVSKATTGHTYRVSDNSDPDKPHFAHRPAPDTESDTAASPEKSGKSDDSGPTLHPRAKSGDTGSASAPAATQQEVDPDRPTFHRHDTQTAASSATADPNRPHLSYTTPESQEKLAKPDALFGMPADMKQVAGISDSNSLDTESFAFTWANPDDAQKMQDALQKVAEQAIGPVKPAPPHTEIASSASPAPSPDAAPAQTPAQPPAQSRPSLQGGRPSLDAGRPSAQPVPSPAKSSPSSQRARSSSQSHTARQRTKQARAAQAPPVLEDVQFRVFSLSLGGGSTMVYSARAASDPEKYVTIIAQPDFYGNAQVLLKHVASASNLDAAPRMRLIDAVDTQGDGRADLIFELRGQSYRQFAIYRIAGGQATQVFATQPAPLS